MRTVDLLGCLLLGLWSASALQVELGELVNPSLAAIYSSPYSGVDENCSLGRCKGLFTRDGSLSADSRFGCTQQEILSGIRACSITYKLNEDSSDDIQRTISSVHVAFTADSETTLQVMLDDVVIVESWAGVAGETGLQEIPGLAGYPAHDLELVPVMDEGSFIGITETAIYVEVDDVPITGIPASERVSLTASATVNDESAGDTLDGITTSTSSWSCSEGDVCEITYDLLEVQSMEQLRIAFVDESSTAGATFNVYTAGSDGIFDEVLAGVTAGPRDSSLSGLQTYGGLRQLVRYVKIEGMPGSGGEFTISEVDIRVNEDAPSYPTTVDDDLVPLGLLPLGGASRSSRAEYDSRPASEGGCSAGHQEGCSIYNIKDGDNTADSRWSCSPLVDDSQYCSAHFRLNTHRYLRQVQLAFHKGDERHNEFSIHVQTEGGWVIVVPSAISSGDTTDFQTWDVSAWTNTLQLIFKFNSVSEWISIKEMIILEQAQGSRSTPVLTYEIFENLFPSDILPEPYLKTKFSFDLESVGSVGWIEVGNGGQTARIWALKMKFAPNQSFTFDIQYEDEDDNEISTRYTSAGGARRWETFVLPERVILKIVRIVAVEGPDKEDYPTLRVSDCQVLGKPYSPGATWVMSTTIQEWDYVPDFIGDGSGDQEEIMEAICYGIGEGFDGTDCDGVATGEDKALTVNLVGGDYFLDGPVYLKSGISLLGVWSEDTSNTEFHLHGRGTGADGIIIADGVEGVVVDNFFLYSNLETAGTTGTVGNVCVDVRNSKGISIDKVAGYDCPMANTRFVDTDNITLNEISGGGFLAGPEIILEGASDFVLTESYLDGVLITDSSNILFEGISEDGAFVGSIGVPQGGDQAANLVVSGTTSGLTLKNFYIGPGVEPRIVLENSNLFTIDGVDMSGGEVGDCIIQIPEGSDGDAILVQLNVLTELTLEDDCFVLA